MGKYRNMLGKAKVWCLNALKPCGRIVLRCIRILDLAAFVIIPFLHNAIDHCFAQYVWYPACALDLVLTVVDCRNPREQKSENSVIKFMKTAGQFGLPPIMLSIFVCNYYDCVAVIFIMAAIMIPVFLLLLYRFNTKYNGCDEAERKVMAWNLIKLMLLGWSVDLFFVSAFNGWRALTYISGVISVVVIFYNLTTVFLKGVKVLRILLPFELLVGLGLSVYMIYTIPDEQLQEIVLTIVASVFGGLLALIGVAWTIRSGNEARRADLLRVELERKEEERKKHIPYIRVSFIREQPPVVANADIATGLDLTKHEDRACLDSNTFYLVDIKNFNIKNISSANIVLNGVVVHGEFYKFLQTEILEPGACCQIRTTNNHSISLEGVEQFIELVISDALGNQYKTECSVSYEFNSSIYGVQTTINGEEFTGISYTYVVTSVGLPQLMK